MLLATPSNRGGSSSLRFVAMHPIEIDDEVYRELERHVQGFETPNDVLRRLLLISMDPKDVAREVVRSVREQGNTTPATWRVAVQPQTKQSFPGDLQDLLRRGLVGAGDELVHRQTRKGRTFKANVTEGGSIATEKRRYTAPSPALGELLGTEVNGWKGWTHVRSGKTLAELRDEL